MTKKKLTVKEVAASAGVSVGTVSNVLNNPERVSPVRRRRVEETVRLLRYQPSQLARGLRTQSTGLLGCIVPDIANPFFPNLVRGAEDVAFREGYRLVLCNADNDPEKESMYFSELLTLHPAGMIVIPATECLLETRLKETNVPVVLVDRCPSWWDGDAVTANNLQGGRAIGAYLASMGHKVVAAISGPRELSSARDRIQGFRSGLKKARLSLPAKYVLQAPFQAEAGFAAAMQLIALKPRPTAIFAGSDVIALGALAAIREAGLRCPEDISLVGFDDLTFASFAYPPLTTVYQPGYAMGAEACRILLTRVRGARGVAQRPVLDTELRVRDSVQAMKAGKQTPK